ncbi:MAG: nucleotide exchange factor GrpE [Kiritimatiellae bacterium]|nr:nucleotide exchange factor GrpE [Kiritimatiellia bacterium]
MEKENKVEEMNDSKVEEAQAMSNAAPQGDAASETPEEKVQNEEVKEEKAAEPDWKDQYARTLADFDNFRRRTIRDREELLKQASADIIKQILPSVDNLLLALSKAENLEDPFVAGVKLVYDGILKTLESNGATPIDSLGEPFDTSYHEALAQLPSEEVEEGHVMTEVKRGWLLNGKLLRAAQVVVSSGKGE